MAQPKERDKCKKGNAAWQEWKIIPFLPVSSKFCHDYPMLENLFLITGTSLANPYMMLAIAEDEIIIKACFFL